MSKVWLSKYYLSSWAINYCRCIEDRQIIRQLIVGSWYSLMYCIYVKDRKEIRKNISKPEHIRIYENNNQENKNRLFL